MHESLINSASSTHSTRQTKTSSPKNNDVFSFMSDLSLINKSQPTAPVPTSDAPILLCHSTVPFYCAINSYCANSNMPTATSTKKPTTATATSTMQPFTATATSTTPATPTTATSTRQPTATSNIQLLRQQKLQHNYKLRPTKKNKLTNTIKSTRKKNQCRVYMCTGQGNTNGKSKSHSKRTNCPLRFKSNLRAVPTATIPTATIPTATVQTDTVPCPEEPSRTIQNHLEDLEHYTNSLKALHTESEAKGKRLEAQIVNIETQLL